MFRSTVDIKQTLCIAEAGYCYWIMLSVDPQIMLSVDPQIMPSVDPQIMLSVGLQTRLVVDPQIMLSVDPQSRLVAVPQILSWLQILSYCLLQVLDGGNGSSQSCGIRLMMERFITLDGRNLVDSPAVL